LQNESQLFMIISTIFKLTLGTLVVQSSIHQLFSESLPRLHWWSPDQIHERKSSQVQSQWHFLKRQWKLERKPQGSFR
jgi:hypothetical protein